MQNGGKSQRQRVIATSSAGSNTRSRMFFVCDKVSGRRFMVDNGAELSVIPPSPADRRNLDPGFTLQAVNKTSIATYGRRLLSLDFGLRRKFSFIFVIADVSTALLGADFLDTFDLKVDVRRIRLEDHKTGLCIQGKQSVFSSLDIRVCRPQLLLPPCSSTEIKHDIMHHFRHFIEGCDIVIFTDHKPLTFCLRSHSDRYSDREVRQLDFISQFCSDIRHVSGTHNDVADAFSCVAINAVHFPAGIDFALMAAQQQRTDRPKADAFPGFHFEDVPLPDGKGTILCKVSTGINRPLVPENLRCHAFFIAPWHSCVAEPDSCRQGEGAVNGSLQCFLR